jgi:hypothetical protein
MSAPVTEKVQLVIGFAEIAERYKIDLAQCSARRGWAQLNTTQDAIRYGAWASPSERKILAYRDGELFLWVCADHETFIAEIRGYAASSRKRQSWLGIDPGNNRLRRRFVALGLNDLLFMYWQDDDFVLDGRGARRRERKLANAAGR